MTEPTVGLIRIRDTVSEENQQFKRVVMKTIIDILVPDDAGGFKWVDISKAVRLVRPTMEVGSVATVHLYMFGGATEIDALQVTKESIEEMREFVERWDEAHDR